MQVLHKATFVPDKVARALLGKEKDQANLPVAQKVWKSVKLWSMYADLEESLGTLESTMAVYDRMIELKVITPQILINYAHLLEEHKHFEDSFTRSNLGRDFRLISRNLAIFRRLTTSASKSPRLVPDLIGSRVANFRGHLS
mgnify:CR=1 FL=1